MITFEDCPACGKEMRTRSYATPEIENDCLECRIFLDFDTKTGKILRVQISGDEKIDQYLLATGKQTPWTKEDLLRYLKLRSFE